jgi:hypothetical protein
MTGHERRPHPYRILAVDTRDPEATALVRVRQFDVDDPIASLPVSLNAADHLEIDFDTPYHATYKSALYGLERVDYAQLPVNFDRYREPDQARIVNRMLAVLEAAQAGHDLETGAFAVRGLGLA